MSVSHPDGAFRGLPCAMRAAEDPALRLHAVTDHAAPAMLARGRQRVDRAFEAIVRTADAVEADLHRLRVLASTHYAACHGALLWFVSCLITGLPLRPEAATPMPAGKEPMTTDHAMACHLPHLPAGATSHASKCQILGTAHTTREPRTWVGSRDGALARAWDDACRGSRFCPTRRRPGGTPDREPDRQRERGDDPAR